MELFRGFEGLGGGRLDSLEVLGTGEEGIELTVPGPPTPWPPAAFNLGVCTPHPDRGVAGRRTEGRAPRLSKTGHGVLG